MKIRMINGATRIGNEIKTPESGVFEVECAVGATLVSRGVAEEVSGSVATPLPDDFGGETVENAPAASEAENGAENDESGTSSEKFWDDTLAGEIKQSLGEAPSEGEEATDSAELEDDVVEYSVEMKAQELRDLAAEFGITFPAVCSKAKMVEALDAYFADLAEGGNVDLTPSDPV